MGPTRNLAKGGSISIGASHQHWQQTVKPGKSGSTYIPRKDPTSTIPESSSLIMHLQFYLEVQEVLV